MTSIKPQLSPIPSPLRHSALARSGARGRMGRVSVDFWFPRCGGIRGWHSSQLQTGILIETTRHPLCQCPHLTRPPPFCVLNGRDQLLSTVLGDILTPPPITNDPTGHSATNPTGYSADNRRPDRGRRGPGMTTARCRRPPAPATSLSPGRRAGLLASHTSPCGAQPSTASVSARARPR